MSGNFAADKSHWLQTILSFCLATCFNKLSTSNGLKQKTGDTKTRNVVGMRRNLFIASATFLIAWTGQIFAELHAPQELFGSEVCAFKSLR
tara:strand:- start:584 stop:856 length:273 start_codon:yes stop_codon:yes gene_type:complete